MTAFEDPMPLRSAASPLIVQAALSKGSDAPTQPSETATQQQPPGQTSSDSDAWRPYEYTRIHRGQFRVLRLHPAPASDPQAPLVGELVVVDLDSVPARPALFTGVARAGGADAAAVGGSHVTSTDPVDDDDVGSYEALSYVWGSSATPHFLYTPGGERIAITASLRSSLLRIRLQLPDEDGGKDATAAPAKAGAGVRTLWVDGVCINQADVAEKEQQVPIMGHVFGQARRVLCDLGDEGDGSAEALALLDRYWRRRIAEGQLTMDGTVHPPADVALFLGVELPEGVRDEEADEGEGNGGDEADVDAAENAEGGDEEWEDADEEREEGSDVQEDSDDDIPDIDDPRWSCVGAFFRRPWFRRLWIVQEFVLAREPVMLCGSATVAWRELLAGCLGYVSGQPYLGSAMAQREWYGFLSFTLMCVTRVVREADAAWAAGVDDDDDDDGTRTRRAAERERVHDIALAMLGQASSTRMVDLLDSFRMCLTTLDRDHYFALIGLADDSDDLRIVPDYSSPIEDVVVEVGRALVVRPGGESMLMRAGVWRDDLDEVEPAVANTPTPSSAPPGTPTPASPVSEEDDEDDGESLPPPSSTSPRPRPIPTWIQDFTVQDGGILHIVENPLYRAAGSTSFVASLSSSDDTLAVLAHRVDVLAAVAPPFRYDPSHRVRAYEHASQSLCVFLSTGDVAGGGGAAATATYKQTGEHLLTAAWKALFAWSAGGGVVAEELAAQGFAAIQWAAMAYEPGGYMRFYDDLERWKGEEEDEEGEEEEEGGEEEEEGDWEDVDDEQVPHKESVEGGDVEAECTDAIPPATSAESKITSDAAHAGRFDLFRALEIIAPLQPPPPPARDSEGAATAAPATTVMDLLEQTGEGAVGGLMAETMRAARTRREGWIGAVMPGSRPGDEVWLLRGCPLPVVLRRVEDGEEEEEEEEEECLVGEADGGVDGKERRLARDAFRDDGRRPMKLVGACYLYGAMNGEILQRPGFEWECVTLR